MKKRAGLKVPATFLLSVLVLAAMFLSLHAGFNYVAVLTDSMDPAIPKGSIVITFPTWLKKPAEGDVILFRLKFEKGEWRILHRLVKEVEAGYYTKGDNRKFKDPWVVDEEAVEGVVVLSIPLAGYFLLLLRPFGVATIMGILTYSLVVELIRQRKSFEVVC